jgi:hypothetical protein
MSRVRVQLDGHGASATTRIYLRPSQEWRTIGETFDVGPAAPDNGRQAIATTMGSSPCFIGR